MIIGINERNEIKQLNNVTDTSLIKIPLVETEEGYPFVGWSDTRILCSCYKKDEGGVTVYPYVNTDKIDEIETEILNLQAQVIELEFEKIGGTTV